MSKEVVADSNVIVKWFIDEEYSIHARMLRDDHLLGRITVVSPKYALLEILNALRKYRARGLLREDHIREIYRLIPELEIDFRAINEEIALKALVYALENSITVYDAYFILLAQSLDTLFYTADDKLLKKISESKNPPSLN